MNVKASPRGFWFVLVLAAAVAVRLWHLTTWDLWTDEMNTLTIAHSGVYSFGPAYSTAPINFILTRWAVRVLGYGELGGRFVPVVAGLITVALVYLLGRNWVGRRAALLGSAVVALSTWHVSWSQNARHFSLETLAVLLAIHCFLLYWKQGRWIGVIGTPGFLLIALFIHSSAGFYLAALVVFVVGSWCYSVLCAGPVRSWRPKRQHLVMLVALTAGLAVYLPLYLKVGRYLLDNPSAWNSGWNILGSFVFYVPPWLSMVAVAGAASLAYERDGLSALFLALIIVPIVLVTAASAYTPASAAYCLGSLPVVALLVGVACDRLLALGVAAGRRWVTVLIVSAIFGAESADLVLYHAFYNGLKPRWRAVASYVAAHRGPNDAVLATEADVMRFYLRDLRVQWLGRTTRNTDIADRPTSARSSWVATYVDAAGAPALSVPVQRFLADSSVLVRFFPLHYGPKDRTIALYFVPHRQSAGAAAGR